MTNVGSTEEQILLDHLLDNGASTERELEDALGDIDQIGADDIAEWAEDASGRGLIEPVAGSTARRRWIITDSGRRAVGNNPGRP